MKIDEILCPTDLSDSSERALDHAVAWARRHGARLHVLHAVVPEGIGAPDPTALRDKAEEAIAAQLDAHGADDLETVLVVEPADAASRAIVEYADERKIDLVVVGTHGRVGFGSLLVGSVAEEVIRETRRPVLAVRPTESTESTGPPSKILAPLDFSATAGSAVRTARGIAAESGASLVLLHVIEEVIVPDFYYPIVPSLVLDGPELQRESENALRRLYDEAGGPDVEVELVVRNGRAATDIARYAEEIGADLIVMPTHGLSGVDRLLLGSTTDKVLRRAPCPVLVLPAEVAGAEEASGRSAG